MSDEGLAKVIRSIAADAAPVVPLRSVTRRLGAWALWCVVAVIGVIALLGPRHDAPAALARAPLLVQAACMALLAAVAGAAALQLAVPGADPRRTRASALIGLAVWPVGLAAWELMRSGTMARFATEPAHHACAEIIAIASLVPTLAMIVMVRHGAPLQRVWAGAMAGVAGASAGAVAVAFICPIDRLPHLVFAHALPTIAIGAIFGLLAASVVRPPRARVLRGAATIVVAGVAASLLTAHVAAAPRMPADAPLPEFRVAATAGGYVTTSDMLQFLHTADSGVRPASPLAGRGPLLIGVAILAGGLLLNLTPCVLPMIPINLAIIGAGRAAASRRRGWWLGAAYGGAMALVYGVLGGVIAATTGRFGVINASPWFNAGVAVLFVVLGLAMFDVIALDFSRLSGRVDPAAGGRTRGSMALAVFMGGVAALLAGACVAPVVIQVVALSSQLYAGGSRAALALPLVLGVGMGLPWPFAGAGLAALPKPGAWMVHVKHALGVCILLTAAYYGYEAWTIAHPRTQKASSDHPGWHQSLDEGLAAARAEGKPVFLDVWATWCKNCVVMDATTFKDDAVRAALDGYVKVRVQAEDLERPDIAALLDRLDSVGLPTYAVLHPVSQP